MLEFDVESYKEYLSQEGHIILSANSLAKQLGENNFNWIAEQSILKEVHGEELNHIGLELPFGENGDREEFVVFWQSNEYVLEPSADHLPIIKQYSLPEKVFKVATVDFIKVVASANGYSHGEAKFPLQEGFFFVGTRKFGSRTLALLLFMGNPEVDFERISSQIKTAQNFVPSSSYVVLVFSENSHKDVPNDFNFSMSPVRSNLLVSPIAYKKLGIFVQDVVGQIKYPVLIDHERELIFIFGKQVTKQTGTTLYKYLRDFILHTQHSAMAYALFCSEYCKDRNGEASRIIGERKKEAIEALKKAFGENTPEYLYSTNGLFSYDRGFLKSHFKIDDIFEW